VSFLVDSLVVSYKSVFIQLSFLLTPELMAQDGQPETTSRVDQIQAERAAKPVSPYLDKSSTVEKSVDWIKDALRISRIHFSVEGLGPGAGITASSLFQWSNSTDQIRPKLFASGTLDLFYTVGTGVDFPHAAGRNLTFALEGSHSDAPQLDYYGPGPDSSIHNRTDYRREDTLFQFRAESRLHRHLIFDCGLGELLVNVGPGTNDSLPSTQSVFGPSQAPGIDNQSNYFIGGCSAQLDLRDFPDDPDHGTYAAAGYARYSAQDIGNFSFNRFFAAAEQYFPFWNEKRVIALRARTELNFHSDDQVVPFYLQPTLGNDLELRGYRRYRFYDENLLAMTAEYRWAMGTRFDMAVFADFGNVFNRPGQILSEMKSSGGFGIRLKNQTAVIARLDFGFSREGAQVWFRYGKRF
jgi:Omp85 superfamily domain